jgi:hypothetical protein
MLYMKKFLLRFLRKLPVCLWKCYTYAIKRTGMCYSCDSDGKKINTYIISVWKLLVRQSLGEVKRGLEDKIKTVYSTGPQNTRTLWLLYDKLWSYILQPLWYEPGQLSWYSDWLWAGISGFVSQQGQGFLCPPSHPDQLSGPPILLSNGQ